MVPTWPWVALSEMHLQSRTSPWKTTEGMSGIHTQDRAWMAELAETVGSDFGGKCPQQQERRGRLSFPPQKWAWHGTQRRTSN